MPFGSFFNTVLAQNTLGALILAAFFTVLGILARGMLSNHGSITVAKINSDTTLGAKAIETLTTALEVLRDENKSLKQSMSQLESHIEYMIDLIIVLVKAKTEEDIGKAAERLEQFLRSIGRWPY